MILSPTLPARPHRGLTLMETVIAVGVIAVAVPLILAATSGGVQSRLQAEADTRAAWIAKAVRRDLLDAWAGLPGPWPSGITPSFPAFGSNSSPLVLLYNSEGAFLETGSPTDLTQRASNPAARYVIALHGTPAMPSALPSGSTSAAPLSLIHLRIHHPANSPGSKRQILDFPFLTSRHAAH